MDEKGNLYICSEPNLLYVYKKHLKLLEWINNKKLLYKVSNVRSLKIRRLPIIITTAAI